MLEFRRAEHSDISHIRAFFDTFKEYSCEFSAVNLIIWQQYFDFKFCIDDGVLYSKNSFDGSTSFGIPFAKDMPAAIEKINEYCEKEGIKPAFFCGQGERLDLLNEQMPNSYKYIEKRDSFEYIYESENLATLSGKKYHSKRNHISSFKKKYQWSYEPLCNDNVKDVLIMLNKWYRENALKINSSMDIEREGLNKILSDLKLPGVRGGVLYVDGQVVAFTLGCEISKEVFDVNIEKALSDYDGAYAMINQQFVINELIDYKYINREDDMGIEGLRKAKLSYKPSILLPKYLIIPEEKDG
jgi:hypothetical protein